MTIKPTGLDILQKYSNNVADHNGAEYSSREMLDQAEAAAALLNAELERIGEVPDDIENYGGELRGKFELRAELKAAAREFWSIK